MSTGTAAQGNAQTGPGYGSPVFTEEDLNKYTQHPAASDVIVPAAKKLKHKKHSNLAQKKSQQAQQMHAQADKLSMKAQKHKQQADELAPPQSSFDLAKLQSEARNSAPGAAKPSGVNKPQQSGAFGMSLTDDYRAGVRTRPSTGPISLAGNYDESQHPRGEGGKWTAEGGEAISKAAESATHQTGVAFNHPAAEHAGAAVSAVESANEPSAKDHARAAGLHRSAAQAHQEAAGGYRDEAADAHRSAATAHNEAADYHDQLAKGGAAPSKYHVEVTQYGRTYTPRGATSGVQGKLTGHMTPADIRANHENAAKHIAAGKMDSIHIKSLDGRQAEVDALKPGAKLAKGGAAPSKYHVEVTQYGRTYTPRGATSGVQGKLTGHMTPADIRANHENAAKHIAAGKMDSIHIKSLDGRQAEVDALKPGATAPEPPAVMKHLVSRVSYPGKGDAFLAGDVARTSKADLDAIDKHLVAIKHPLAMQAGTQHNRAEQYARELHAKGHYKPEGKSMSLKLANENTDVDTPLINQSGNENTDTDPIHPKLKGAGGSWTMAPDKTTTMTASIPAEDATAAVRRLRSHPDVQAVLLPGQNGQVTCCVSAFSNSGRMHTEKTFSDAGASWPGDTSDDDVADRDVGAT